MCSDCSDLIQSLCLFHPQTSLQSVSERRFAAASHDEHNLFERKMKI